MFNPHTAGTATHVNTYTSDKQGDKTSDQQIKGDCAHTNMADGSQDYDIGYEVPKTEIMRSSPKKQEW